MTDWRADLVEHLATVIHSAEPALVEERKWRKPTSPDSVPTFSCGGQVCTVETYQDTVKVTFAKGAALPDLHGVFNASLDAGTRRAVDTKQDDAFVDLVRAAVALGRG